MTLPAVIRKLVCRQAHQAGLRAEELELERLTSEAESLILAGTPISVICGLLGAREGDAD